MLKRLSGGEKKLTIIYSITKRKKPTSWFINQT